MVNFLPSAEVSRYLTKSEKDISKTLIGNTISYFADRIAAQREEGYFTYTSNWITMKYADAMSVTKILKEAGYESNRVSGILDHHGMYKFSISWA